MNTQTNESKNIDILNRDDFINRTVQLVESVSSRKGNITFAIKGQWGCGKTFVLERIENKLSETNRFLVVHYNCWQYDYYEEPLVAIVSALQKRVDSFSFVSEESKVKIKAVASKICLNLGTQLIKNHIGIDISEVKEAWDEASEKASAIHSYDQYYGFNQALEDIKNELAKLSENYTLVFAVDELDRCLPEYAIKVLERLHHISEGIPNFITVIAVDKSKLEHTISSIFGSENIATYLKKFIKFEIKLDNGKQDGTKFWDKFSSFRDRFDENLFPKLEKQKEFIEELFQGIDARSQEHIIEKAALFNDICYGEEKQDYSMMYMELFIATFYYHYGEENFFSNDKVIHDLEQVFEYKNIPKSFGTKGSGFYLGNNEFVNGGSDGLFYINPYNIFMLVIHYWYGLLEGKRTVEDIYIPYIEPDQSLSRIGDNQNKLINNINIFKIIK